MNAPPMYVLCMREGRLRSLLPFLEQTGCQTQRFATLADAQQLMKRRSTGVVFVDTTAILAEAAAGIAALRLAEPHARIVVFASAAEPQRVAALLGSGADDVIGIERSLSEVIARLSRFCRG